MRGIGCYAGHYYSIDVFETMIQEDLWDQMDKVYFAYIVGFLLVSVAGLVFQFTVRRKAQKKKKMLRNAYTSDVMDAETSDVMDAEMPILNDAEIPTTMDFTEGNDILVQPFTNEE